MDTGKLPAPKKVRTKETGILVKVNGYLSGRAVRDNWLIGKGVILKPSFAASVVKDAETVIVRITGTGGTVGDFECTRVITSKYRPEIAFVLDQAEGAPVIRKLVPLQNARRTLLAVIKPKSSVTPEEFYAAATRDDGGTQVNARRRWGELRTEYGFDTTYDESKFVRGQELPVIEPNPRPNQNALNDDHWPAVYRAGGGICNKCGRPIRLDDSADAAPGLLDHRRPVPAGGTDDRTNLQLFCVVCNNTKNTVCQKCPINFNCESCTWAFPERFHDTVVVALSAEEAAQLEIIAEAEEKDPRVLAKELLLRALRVEKSGGEG